MNMRPINMPQTFAPDPENKRRLRDAFGKFATGVTIVTCQTENGPVCMTANSFSSISLDPALVMWAVDKGSSRFPAFSDCTDFAIHVLDADQEALALDCARNARALETMSFETSPAGVPLIAGCLARFECQQFSCHEAGDHLIVVGQVIRAEMRDGAPLAFFAGAFGQFAQR